MLAFYKVYHNFAIMPCGHILYLCISPNGLLVDVYVSELLNTFSYIPKNPV